MNSVTFAAVLSFFILSGLAIGFTVNYTPYFTQYICQDRAKTWKTGINRYFLYLSNTKKNQNSGKKTLDPQPNRHIHQTVGYLALWGVTDQELDDSNLRNISTLNDLNRLSDLVSSLKGEMSLVLKYSTSRQEFIPDLSRILADPSTAEKNTVITAQPPAEITNLEQQLFKRYGEKIEISPPYGTFFKLDLDFKKDGHLSGGADTVHPDCTWLFARNITGKQLSLNTSYRHMFPAPAVLGPGNQPGPSNQPGPVTPRVPEIQPAPEIQTAPSSPDSESLDGLSPGDSIASRRGIMMMNPRNLSQNEWWLLAQITKGKRLVLQGRTLDQMFTLDQKHFGLFPRDGPGDTSNRPYTDAKELSPQDWHEIAEIAGGRRIIIYGQDLEKMYLVNGERCSLRLVEASKKLGHGPGSSGAPSPGEVALVEDQQSVDQLVECLSLALL